MIRNILFDIDDTLFPSTEFSSLARRNAVNAMIAMGLEGQADSLSAQLSEIIQEKGPNHPGHFDELCRRLGVRRPGRYIAAAVAAYHDTKSSIQPFPTVPLTLLRLRQDGHMLHVATNGSTIKQWDKLIRLRIALYFDEVFVSEELGRSKDKAFYQEVLKRLGASPSECMMVGDREDADIGPAKSAGIMTVRLRRGKYAAFPSQADFIIDDISALQSLSILKPSTQ